MGACSVGCRGPFTAGVVDLTDSVWSSRGRRWCCWAVGAPKVWHRHDLGLRHGLSPCTDCSAAGPAGRVCSAGSPQRVSGMKISACVDTLRA